MCLYRIHQERYGCEGEREICGVIYQAEALRESKQMKIGGIAWYKSQAGC